MILLSIQCNLAAGTLAPYAESRPELRPPLEADARLRRLVRSFISPSSHPYYFFPFLFPNHSAQFLLTRARSWMDARHLETTATLLPSGEYDLHTPCLEASK